jgi:CheY-like chemotaxis protein
MSPSANKTILVVDDDIDLRETLGEVLEDEGYRVELAGNGQEALESLRGGLEPSLILLDLMMPVMDGWQFRAEQRRDELLSGIPVVIVSASGNWHEQEERLEAECVRKPIDFDRLLALIERKAR